MMLENLNMTHFEMSFLLNYMLYEIFHGDVSVFHVLNPEDENWCSGAGRETLRNLAFHTVWVVRFSSPSFCELGQFLSGNHGVSSGDVTVGCIQTKFGLEYEVYQLLNRSLTKNSIYETTANWFNVFYELTRDYGKKLKL